MTTELISTIKGTARFQDKNGLLEDLNIEIVETYWLLSKDQVDELYNYASTEITDIQENNIREMV
jgi:hypothetical protein